MSKEPLRICDEEGCGRKALYQCEDCANVYCRYCAKKSEYTCPAYHPDPELYRIK